MGDFNPLVLLIPVIAGFIGWFTNWLAVKATLYPVEFVGIPPAFGWQGVIPKNTEEMSKSFSHLISDKLVDMEGLFAEIDHEDNEEIDEVVEDVSVEIIRELSTNIAPDSWARAREKLREYINMLVRRNVRKVTVEILDRMSKEAGDFIDIDEVAHEALVADRALLGRVLMDVAGPEFKFIERSGLWFGFLFGILQMFVWIVYPQGWVLPVAGFLVGYITNWLAMNLIYEPREPVKVGPWTIQGDRHSRDRAAVVIDHGPIEGAFTAGPLRHDHAADERSDGPAGQPHTDGGHTRNTRHATTRCSSASRRAAARRCPAGRRAATRRCPASCHTCGAARYATG